MATVIDGRSSSRRPPPPAAASEAGRPLVRGFGAAWDDVDERDETRDWLLDEPDLVEVVDVLMRLIRRGQKRRWLAFAITFVLLTGLVARQATNIRRYPAKVVLGVTENPRIEEGTVQTSNELKSYVTYAVFTDTAILAVLKKNHFREAAIEKTPRIVLESFREDCEVDVSKNEFAAPRLPGDTRSALVSIELWLPNPEQAISIVRDLSDLVVARDEQNNAERVKIERALATETFSLAGTNLDRLWRERLKAAHEIETADVFRTAELKVKLDNLDRALVGAKARVDDAERARRKLDFAAAASQGSVALRWDHVDRGSAAIKVDERFAISEVAVIGFLVLLPLMLLGVGAFNPTVYDDRDVRWLGLTALGVVKTTAVPLPSAKS